MSSVFYRSRFGQVKKTTVEDSLVLDINQWSKEGVLRPGFVISGRLSLTSEDGEVIGSINFESHCSAEPPFVRIWYQFDRSDVLYYPKYLCTWLLTIRAAFWRMQADHK